MRWTFSWRKIRRRSVGCTPSWPGSSTTTTGWRRAKHTSSPMELYDAIVADRWLGITVPKGYGSHSFGIGEAALLIEEIAKFGGGVNARAPSTCRSSVCTRCSSMGRRSSGSRILPRIVIDDCYICFGGAEPGRVWTSGDHPDHHLRAPRRRPSRRRLVQGLYLQGPGVREGPAAEMPMASACWGSARITWPMQSGAPSCSSPRSISRTRRAFPPLGATSEALAAFKKRRAPHFTGR